MLSGIDWQSMFVPTGSILEVLLRGTIMYLGMFAMLRVFRRQAGSIGMADLLVIVVIADAAQNGMAGESRSVTEALALVATIILWDWFFDFLGFRSTLARKVIEPQPLPLIRNGRILRRNLDREMITEDELMSQLRIQGIDDVSDVRLCSIESNGEFSVLQRRGSAKRKGNKSGPEAVK